MYTANNDNELHGWLIWADQHGTNFLRKLVEAAMTADIPNYLLLRPVLIELKKEWPKPV